jgi:hypothetical protein
LPQHLKTRFQEPRLAGLNQMEKMVGDRGRKYLGRQPRRLQYPEAGIARVPRIKLCEVIEQGQHVSGLSCSQVVPDLLPLLLRKRTPLRMLLPVCLGSLMLAIPLRDELSKIRQSNRLALAAVDTIPIVEVNRGIGKIPGSHSTSRSVIACNPMMADG